MDSKLKFENHLSSTCDKVSRKINALGGIVNYMNLGKCRILTKIIIDLLNAVL